MGDQLLTGSGGRLALDGNLSLDVPAAERRPLARPHGVHAGQRGETRQQLIEEDGAPGALLVFGEGERDPEGEDALAIETEVGAHQGAIATNEQTGSRHQHQREGDLAHYQDRACPRAAPSDSGAGRALAQRAAEVEVAPAQRRQSPEERRRRKREKRHEDEHGAVDAEGHVEGRAVGKDAIGEANAHGGEGDPEQRPHPGNHEALGEELPDHPSAVGADRRADGELARARCPAHQEQVGDVGASDQQHAADGAEEDPQRPPQVAHEVLAQRDQLGLPAQVVHGSQPLQVGREARHLRPGGGERDTPA